MHEQMVGIAGFRNVIPAITLLAKANGLLAKNRMHMRGLSPRRLESLNIR